MVLENTTLPNISNGVFVPAGVCNGRPYYEKKDKGVLGRNDDALESARRALEVGPPPGPAETDERLEVTLRAGLALLALERHEEAGVVLDSILDEAPENSEAWAALGVAMAAL